MQRLDDRVEYFITGYPEENSIKNFKSAGAAFPFQHSALTTIYGQSIYFLKSLEFKENFDIIHAFDWTSYFAGYLCKQYFKKPLVCTMNLSLKQLNKQGIFQCHDPKTIDGIHINQILINFEKLGLMNADRVIQVSNYYYSLYPEYMSKSVLIPNGIDIDRWVKKRNPNLPGKNKLKVCYIGRASIMKGLDIILECDIPDDIDFYFVVSPKNAEEPYFSQISEKCNNKNIFHIPGLYGQDKIDFLFAMDAVIMPSKHEPFGIVALEALASKNILLASRVDGLGDFLTNNNSIDCGHTAESITTALNYFTQLTDSQKQTLINNGLKVCEQYTWDLAAEQYYDIYKSMLEVKK